jgi:hypothetical protein
MADAFAGWHYTLPSDAIAEFVTRHADQLLDLPYEPLAQTLRRRLEVITVGAHVQAASEAFCVGDRRQARRYFALARNCTASRTATGSRCATSLRLLRG